MTKPARTEPEVLGPAIVTALHEQDREVSTVAGSQKGWSVKQPWEQALSRGRLAHGSTKYTPEMREMAWRDYAVLWWRRFPRGKDSTQGLSVSGGAADAGSLAQSQIDAMRLLESLEGRGTNPCGRPLSVRDTVLVKMVCGEGFSVPEAVRMIQPSYKFSTWPRFCEALDALIEAFTEGRR
jgi:hypothetical protein